MKSEKCSRTDLSLESHTHTLVNAKLSNSPSSLSETSDVGDSIEFQSLTYPPTRTMDLSNHTSDAIDVLSVPYGFPVQASSQHHHLRNGSSSPIQHSIAKASAGKKRKLSSFALAEQGHSPDSEDDDQQDELNGLQRNGSTRKSRPSGTKRACNQCRQQKVR
jgi:hypothetical protein